MTKFDQALSDEEIDQIVNGLIWASGDSFCFGKDVATHIIQAVLAKLAEQQEPVAWRITAKRFFGDFTKDKATAQWWQDAEPESVTPLYAHPMPCVSPERHKHDCVSESREFDRVLSDGEMAVVINNGCTADLFSLAERVEQAVVSKLVAEQEPVMYARTYYGEIDWDEECVTEKNDGALIRATDTRKEDFIRHGYAVIPLYAHPMPSASETEAFVLRCDYCKKETDDPWHGSGVIGDVKSKHIHACDDCVHLLPHPMPCVSPTSDKAACVSENAESDMQRHLEYIKRYQKWRRRETEPHSMGEIGLNGKQIGESLDWLIRVAENHIEEALELVKNQPCGCVVCRCENQGQCQGCGAKSCGTHEVGEIPNPVYVDHIPDAGKMITGHQSNSIDESHAKIMPLVQNYADKRVMAVYGNAGETEVHEAYWNLAARIQAELEALQENSSHIADMRKKVPEGWQLVPKEPTDSMRKAGVDLALNVSIGRFYTWDDYMRGIYNNMLAAAPRYTGDSNE